LVNYFAEAQSWDLDRLQAARHSALYAWRVAAVGAGCTLACALALVLLLPLKRVEPFLIRVDSTTGVVDSVPLYQGRLDLPQSVTRYFLSHYVQTCERFDYATAESDYDECGAFHAARLNQAWAQLWNRANPSSPLNLHRDGSSVSVQIESISFLKRASGIADLAQVRYLKVLDAAGGANSHATHWIATIRYRYTAPPADPSVRRWNPLGFEVVDFVAEPEVLHEPQPSIAAGARP
jgi:type IV secretion system protein VirB8